MVALSEFVMKNLLKCSLADKSCCCHIRLVMKPCYLGNYAFQIKSCWGVLSRSNGRSIKIRHENSPEAPPSGEIMMTSYWVCNKSSLFRKPCISDTKVTIEPYQEFMVALSESVIKIRLKRSIAEKSQWRPVRLPMKPPYLWNHASQMKSYYGTLSESRGRSFRIRHEKSREALPSGEIMMMSYPVGNETLLSRKQCIPDKKLLRNAIKK